jgi:hypothetical protein
MRVYHPECEAVRRNRNSPLKPAENQLYFPIQHPASRTGTVSTAPGLLDDIGRWWRWMRSTG